MFKMLDGNNAAVEAAKAARVKVIAAYPITPQSTISERMSELVDSGELDAQIIRVESEHSAMSAILAAELTGVRAMTATSSNGLALMHEVLCMVSGNRQPVVMPVVNRAVASPWSLWCDHSDSMMERDTGWMQLYCRNVQEVFDLMIVAYSVAENEEVMLPIMVCLDGFFLSHSMQKVDVPAQEDIDAFLGEYKPKNLLLDPGNPVFVCDLTGPEDYTEIKCQQFSALYGSMEIFEEQMEKYNSKFNRELKIADGFMVDDAEAVLVCMGSMSGTAKQVVTDRRASGDKVGLICVSLFRPFPAQKILSMIPSNATVGVFDRNSCCGGGCGPLWTELNAANKKGSSLYSYIGGLGGRDVSTMTVNKVFDELLELAKGKSDKHTQWIDMKHNCVKAGEVC